MVRRYSNDPGRRYTELLSGLVLKGHLSRLEVPPMQETHIRAQGGSYRNLLHVTREFYSIKLICRNLYAIFSHVKKAYTANQNGVQLFHMWTYNQSAIA